MMSVCIDAITYSCLVLESSSGVVRLAPWQMKEGCNVCRHGRRNHHNDDDDGDDDGDDGHGDGTITGSRPSRGAVGR